MEDDVGGDLREDDVVGGDLECDVDNNVRDDMEHNMRDNVGVT